MSRQLDLPLTFDAPPSVCRYAHHQEYHHAIVCATCHGPLSCGPMMHACRVCQSFWFMPCGLCGATRYACCC